MTEAVDWEEVDAYIADCEARESRLNDWERGFIQSVREARDAGQELSTTQLEKLEEIWEKVTAKG